jgi:hypothetical protein
MHCGIAGSKYRGAVHGILCGWLSTVRASAQSSISDPPHKALCRTDELRRPLTGIARDGAPGPGPKWAAMHKGNYRPTCLFQSATYISNLANSAAESIRL